MTIKEVKLIARAYKAYTRSKRPEILVNMTATPQTYEELTGNLAPDNYRRTLANFVEAGIVKVCDRRQSARGRAPLTYAATPILYVCRALSAEGLPALSEAQTAILFVLHLSDELTVTQIAEKAEISRTTAQHHIRHFLKSGYVFRDQMPFQVGEPVFVYRNSGMFAARFLRAVVK